MYISLPYLPIFSSEEYLKHIEHKETRVPNILSHLESASNKHTQIRLGHVLPETSLVGWFWTVPRKFSCGKVPQLSGYNLSCCGAQTIPTSRGCGGSSRSSAVVKKVHTLDSTLLIWSKKHFERSLLNLIPDLKTSVHQRVITRYVYPESKFRCPTGSLCFGESLLSSSLATASRSNYVRWRKGVSHHSNIVWIHWPQYKFQHNG